MGSGYGIVKRRVWFDGQNVRGVQVPGFLGTQGGNEALHEIEGAAEQGLVLLGALAHADEQLVVFVDKRAEQGLIIRRQQRNEVAETRVVGLAEFF